MPIDGIGPGRQDRVWIADVDGNRLVIDAQEPVVQDAALHAEIQSILDSVQDPADRQLIRRIASISRGTPPARARASSRASPEASSAGSHEYG